METGDENVSLVTFTFFRVVAYPLQRWLLTPYGDNGHLTQEELRHIEILSSKRQDISNRTSLWIIEREVQTT